MGEEKKGEEKKDNSDLMEKLISLCKRRGFIFPGSEIYGGLANSWDYGQYGTELKKNIKDAWWKRFVQGRADMVGIDAALIMNPKVWEASGHVGHFSDPLVEDKKTHERYRADHLLEAAGVDVTGMSLDDMARVIAEKGIKSSKGNELTAPRAFNMMLTTHLGPVSDDSSIAYLRPETAQAMFVDWKSVQQTSRRKLPFGIAQMGKAFRNEITPGNFIFRTREFEQMEIEYFVKPTEWEKQFEMWLEEMRGWMKFLGLKKWVEHEIPAADRAHYSARTVDLEFEYPFGVKELYGIAYRGNYDLTKHQESSGEDLSYLDPETNEKILPHVIEPTFGVDRSVLVALLAAYHEDQAPTSDEGETEVRVVLRLPRAIAPIKVAVLPLSKKPELSEPARKLADELRKNWMVEYDETQSIGKRYRRQDEIGTPFCITYDFEALNDQAVTVRERDSMKQERIKISELEAYLKSQF
ncbi:MAG: glycine--tRNA ligase [bacterium]